MNVHDRTDPSDALARRSASALRRDVDRRVDVDAALAAVLSDDGARVLPLAATHDSSSRRPDRQAWLAAAAAVLLVGAGSLAFALTRDDGARVVPADTTPVTDGSPITTGTSEPSAPGTSEPATTPSTVTETTPAPTTTQFIPPADDVLAGLVAPAPLDPVEVPAFLPPTAVADPTQVRLTEYAMPADTVSELVQTWATGSGQVIQVSTLLAGGEPPVSAPADVAPIDVRPWDDAVVVTTMADGYAQVRLADPSGTVTLWGFGYTADELVSVFTRMGLTPDGWRLPEGDATGLVELHSGWRRAEFATRVVQWDTGSVQGELIVSVGSPGSIQTGFFGGAPATLDEVSGAPALVSELGPDASAISWSPAPDVVVTLGFSGSVDEALALVRSLEPVDVATWEAAGVLDTSEADGCNSFFFC